MRKLHLHIGSYKTGSTSIQRTLQVNKKKLLNKYNLLYPGDDECQNLLFFLSKAPPKYWQREFKGIDINVLSKRVVKYTQAIFDEIMDSNKDVIISTEYLFALNTEEYVKNVIKFFEKIFTEIIVYIFVREPANFYKSWQQQSITTRTYVDSPYQFKYDFKNSIKSWSKFCDIEVLKFSKKSSSIDTFFNLLKLNKLDLILSKERENISMGIEQMVLLQEINSYVFPDSNNILNGKIHLKRIPFMNNSNVTKPILRKEIYSLVNNQHYDDLKWLTEKYEVEFSIDFKEPCTIPEKDIWHVEDIYCNYDTNKFESYKYQLINKLLLDA